MTATVSDERTTRPNGGALRQEGRDFYKNALASGEEPTPEQVGHRFGRTAAWGQNRINEVKDMAAATSQAVSPATVTAGDTTTDTHPNGTPRPVEVQDLPEPAPEPPPAPKPLSVPIPPPVLPARPVEHEPPGMPPAEETLAMTADVPPRADGRRVAVLGLVSGILASIAANVMHSRIQGPSSLAELIGAAFWPCALLIAIEVLIRTPWPRGGWWFLTRLAGVGVVGIVAFIVSYRHMQGLLASWGEDWLNSHIGPAAVDGLMLISATALLAISRSRHTNT